MKTPRTLALAALLALPATAALAAGDAASWPAKPVRLIVPFPAGGSTDAVARLVAEQLGSKLGQQFVVDNRPGAGGNIGTDQVAKAAPDGYTLTLTTSGPLANNKFLYRNMPYDPQKDLAPVALVGEIPLIVVANPKAAVKSLKSLVDAARQSPQRYSVGNPGNGTIGHLAFELLRHDTRAELLGVPYKGDTPALTDVLGGSIQAVIAPITVFIPYVQSGKLAGLAVTSARRFPGTPDVPTALEQGFKLDASVWFAIAGPAGMPRPIVDKLNQAVNTVLASPEIRAKLERYGAVVDSGSPEDLAARIKTESATWQRVIEAANIRLD